MAATRYPPIVSEGFLLPAHMSESPWSQGRLAEASPAASSRREVSGLVVAIAVLLGSVVTGSVTWWLQASRVEAKEQERAKAAAEVSGLAERVRTAESAAAAAVQRVQQSEQAAEAARKQVADETAELDAARRDVASARGERDANRVELTAARSELDRLRAADVDPGSLPSMDLRRVMGAAGSQVRSQMDVQVVGASVSGFDEASLEKALASELSAAGFTPTGQSPFKVAAFVAMGREQPRRPLGVMLLLLRNMKVPGESGSREVAVWGEQRISEVADAEAATQVVGMLKALSQTLAEAVLAKASPAASGSAAPGVPPADGPARGTP